MEKRPPLGPQAVRNLSIFALLTALKALGMIIFAAVLGTALAYLARMTYFALIAPRQFATEREEQLAIFAGNGLAQVDGLWVATLGRTPSVGLLVAIGLGAVLLRALADSGLQYFAQKAAVEAKSSIRRQLLQRLLATGGLDTPAGSGATAVLLSRGLNALDLYYSKTLTALVSSMIIPLALWLVIVLHDWVSGLIIALTLPLIPLFMVLIGKTTKTDTQKAQADLLRLSDHVVELVKGLPVLIGLGREKAQARALKELGERYQKTTMFTLKSAFMSSFALELITTLSVAVVAVFIGVRLVNGNIGLDTALLALILAPECYLPLRQVGAAYHQSEDGVAALRTAQDIIERPYPRAKEESQSDRISVKNLSLTYPGRPATLSNVYFSIKHGTTTAIIGPSGIGKSTLLGVLAGTLRDGLIPTGSQEALQVTGGVTGLGQILLVAQNPACLAPSLEREVLLYTLAHSQNQGQRAQHMLDTQSTLDPQESKQARALLARVGLAAQADLHPADLSAGQLRRLAIARVLGAAQALQEAGQQVTILVDEPTAHLDATSRQQVASALAQLKASGATSLIVTHDPQVAASTDNLLEAHSTARLITWTLTSQEAQPLPPQAQVEPQEAPAKETRGEKQQTQPPATESTPGLFQTLATLRQVTDITLKQTLLAGFLSTFTMLAGISLTALSGWLIVRAAEQPAMMYLMLAVVGVRFFGVGRASSRYAERLVTHRIMLGAADRLRLKTWVNANHTVPSVRKLLTGQGVLDRVVGEVDEVRDATPRVILPLLTHAGVLTIVLLATALLEPLALIPVGLAILITSILVPLLVVRADRAAEAASRQATSHMLGLGLGMMDAATEITANRLQGPLLKAFTQADSHNNRALMRGSLAAGLGQGLVSATWWSAAIATFVICWADVRQGNTTAPLVAIIVLLATAMLESTDEFVEAVRNYPAYAQLTQRIRQQFPQDLTPINQQVEALYSDSTATSTQLPAGEELRQNLRGQAITLSLQDATTRWPGMNRAVLTHLDVTATSGQWTGITGPSGSGKSTALALLLGFLPLEEGRAQLTSRATQTLTQEELRGFAAWCPQSSYIFESSIASNLAIARTQNQRPSDQEMYAVLDRVGLGDFVRSLEKGLETPVGAGGSQVSGGQRQRLALARTLLTESPLILLDEPTAHLDAPTAQALMQDLSTATRQQRRGTQPAVVIVSHRQEDIDLCDRLIQLNPTP